MWKNQFLLSICRYSSFVFRHISWFYLRRFPLAGMTVIGPQISWWLHAAHILNSTNVSIMSSLNRLHRHSIDNCYLVIFCIHYSKISLTWLCSDLCRLYVNHSNIWNDFNSRSRGKQHCPVMLTLLVIITWSKSIALILVVLSPHECFDPVFSLLLFVKHKISSKNHNSPLKFLAIFLVRIFQNLMQHHKEFLSIAIRWLMSDSL